ncbi:MULTISPECIES: RDD family protein [Thermomonospora]|uniref:Putative RDD family membrane protein YckC n=1 Tax=Thermomonospora cellulosilytica TaxID=1411118 RepID=A0A7W3RBX2_9ACTN|nr:MULTISPECIES: RDD family protein [Thermomonospora]MBA9006705.1 putative RDD family membrane protein YckC [Thermomonospora cellulosilytica]
MSSGRQTAGGPRWTQTWLGGARSAGADLGYPGERLGLPEQGSRAVAGYGRRLVALFVDWGLCMVISAFAVRVLELPGQYRSLLTLGLFALQAVVLTATIGMTLGKRLCGIRVVRLDGRPVGPVWALVRTALILAVVPALLWDRDHRGLHDRAANTVVINI